MAFAYGRSYAPGVTVYEDAIPAYAAPASFNTVYMLVDAPDETSVTVFPFNRPIPVTSLNEYDNLIGTLPVSGTELTSYYAVKAFFQQVTNGDLRVCRVGTPGVIQQLRFDPSGFKDDGVNAPSHVIKGDVVYLKILVNGIELGDHTPNGGWLGVPVSIPTNYVAGDTENNLEISIAMRDAVGIAIEQNADISAGTYIRNASVDIDGCGDCAALYLTGRLFGTQVEIVPTYEVVGNQFVLASNGYDVKNVTAQDESVFDWIQAVRTAFEDTNLPQGYMIAPAAFSYYNQADRVNLGQTMEEVCSDQNHKWMALVDCGPHDVTSIREYREFQEHSPADGFNPGQMVLVNNTIYQWTDIEPVRFTEAAYDENSEYWSTNPDLVLGDRRALKDDRRIHVTISDPSDPPVDLVANTIRLDEAWPSDIKSGEKILIGPAFVIDVEDRPTLPTYSDAYTDAVNEDLVGVFYVIASDIATELEPNRIKLATSRTRALGNLGIDFVTAGSPGAGGLFVEGIHETVAWEFEVTIKDQTSNLIEVTNPEGASFNTVHLPGTLQKPTREDDFRSQVRRLIDPSKALIRGGRTLKYFASASWDTAAGTLLLDDHGLSTGDEVYMNQMPDGLLPAALTSSETYYAIRVDGNHIQLAATVQDAESGNEIAIADQGTNSAFVKTPNGAAAQGVITTGGDILILSADHGLKTQNVVMFNKDITTDAVRVYRATDADRTFKYLVYAHDRNFFSTAPSASNLAVSAFTNWPTSPIVTSEPVDWYRDVTVAPNNGEFDDLGVVRWLRGRKYQLDCTLAVYAVKDEAGQEILTNNFNPYDGVQYTYDLSTDFRFSAVKAPATVGEYKLAKAEIGPDGPFAANHGYVLGQEVRFSSSHGGTLPEMIEEDRIYYISGPAGIVNPSVVSVAPTLIDAVEGNIIAWSGATAVDGPDGYYGGVTLDANPFTFQYTEDEFAYPLNPFRDFAGENNFYCVPLSYGEQENAELNHLYGHPCLDIDNVQTPLYGAYIDIEFVESNATPPNSIWNFDAVTSQDLIDEALRGTNNNGIPQAKVVEKGMDSHNRLFEESQKYYTTQGFLAYYAPYLKNDVGVFIPPTPYVAGFAMKRYREEIAGFRLPPAGVKYQLAGARGVQVAISTSMQHVSNPYGLNALRQLPGYSSLDPDTGETYGPVFIWGSRTRINPADAKQAMYKFVNTRVIMNVIYGTLSRSLDSQIFSIVDGRAVTFNQIRTIVSNTLYSAFYVPGALFGATAADAFDVIVDDRNNPPAYLEDGLVNVQVFVVPVPTLERIEIDLLRVSIGGIKQAQEDLGYLPWTPNRV